MKSPDDWQPIINLIPGYQVSYNLEAWYEESEEWKQSRSEIWHQGWPANPPLI